MRTLVPLVVVDAKQAEKRSRVDPGVEGKRLARLTTVLRNEQFHHGIEIGIARAKLPCEPVAAALDNSLAVREHIELTGITRRTDSFNMQAVPDEGHETRDLGVVVLSRRAMNDFDLHPALPVRIVSGRESRKLSGCSPAFHTRIRTIPEIPALVIDDNRFDFVRRKRNLLESSDFDDAALTRHNLVKTPAVLEFDRDYLISETGVPTSAHMIEA